MTLYVATGLGSPRWVRAEKMESELPLSNISNIPLIEQARRLHLAGEFDKAARLARHILQSQPANPEALEVVALVEMEHGDLAESIRLLRRIARKLPGRAPVQYNLALAHRYSGRLNAAVDGFRLALKLEPKLKRARNELLSTLANLGRFADLEKECREALRLYPGDTLALNLLAFNCPGALHADDVASMNRRFGDAGLPEGVRASTGFALAEALRLQNRHDEAFATLGKANELSLSQLARPAPNSAIAPAAEQPRKQPLDKAERQHAMLCDFVAATFTREFLDRFSGHGEPSRMPVFVVGMPRSGSTLVEQILASHPSVFGAGEIPDLNLITQMKWPFGGPPTADGKRPELPPGSLETWFRELGLAYVARLRQLDGEAAMVVNKMLGNYLFVGQIELCLPGATIIDVRRDPVDNCLACFQRQFRTGHEFTYDLGALGRQYRRYEKVMEHWDRVLPGRVLRVRYEELVADPQNQIRRLLDHCGLPWNDGVMRFHENARPVRTASLSQVRKPISTASVAKWKPYAAHLGPLFDSLGLERPPEESQPT